MTRRPATPLRSLQPAAILAALVILFGLVPATPTRAALATGQLTLAKVVGGLSTPVGIVNAGDGSGRLFVIQQGGTVRVIKNGALVAGNFLDVSAKLSTGSERGLLGLAFHPKFETNRRLFIYYTGDGGDIVVSRLTANSAKTSAPSSSEVKLFTIEHSSETNHNGGAMAFGPDGMLYLGIGDGGGGGDPNGNAQDNGTRLGKILRINVDGTNASGGQYGYPSSNPFVGKTGDDAIWAKGLRNPWRITFDRSTGDLYIADVGQGLYEEIDRDRASSRVHSTVRNYGWNIMEGKHCYDATSCDKSGLILPIAEYGHDGGNCSITGGYVYRGSTFTDLRGLYVFGDYCSGRIWTMPSSGTSISLRLDTTQKLTSFGQSESGELYVAGIGGTVFRVVAPTDIAGRSLVDDIHWVYEAGLTTGCTSTKFCPTGKVTREQMAIFLDRALDLPSTSTDYFTDDEGRTGEGAINRLAKAGITTGCTPTKYCPSSNVTREQMAIFLDRAIDLPSTGADYFTDDEGRTGEAAINRLAKAGITTGCSPSHYCPTASVTREQMAAFLRRSFE